MAKTIRHKKTGKTAYTFAKRNAMRNRHNPQITKTEMWREVIEVGTK